MSLCASVSVSVCPRVSLCGSMHMSMCVYPCVSPCVTMCVSMYVPVYLCVSTCPCVCPCMSLCVCVSVGVCPRVHTRTYKPPNHTPSSHKVFAIRDDCRFYQKNSAAPEAVGWEGCCVFTNARFSLMLIFLEEKGAPGRRPQSCGSCQLQGEDLTWDSVSPQSTDQGAGPEEPTGHTLITPLPLLSLPVSAGQHFPVALPGHVQEALTDPPPPPPRRAGGGMACATPLPQIRTVAVSAQLRSCSGGGGSQLLSGTEPVSKEGPQTPTPLSGSSPGPQRRVWPVGPVLWANLTRALLSQVKGGAGELASPRGERLLPAVGAAFSSSLPSRSNKPLPVP